MKRQHFSVFFTLCLSLAWACPMVAGFVDGDLEAEFKEFSSVVEAGDPLRLSEACVRRERERLSAGKKKDGL